jgi:hypothetical protein
MGGAANGVDAFTDGITRAARTMAPSGYRRLKSK